jgi:D-3-phosphoglycerate dehydrogenase
MPRVLCTPSILFHVDGPYKKILEGAGLEVVYPPENAKLMDPAVLVEHLQGIDAVAASVEPYSAEVLSKSKLRAIARLGVGYDAVDVPAATARNIAVTTTPGTNEHSVAELMLALLLGVYRGFPGRDQEVRKGIWRRKSLPRLMGKTLGLVGLGRIGKAIVPRAHGLGLKVIAYDPYPDQKFAAANNVRYCTFDELLTEADIVSLHLPWTKTNTDVINAAALAKMKPGSTLINTARGALVDEKALYDALSSGHLYAAGLDVFKEEPLPVDSPLLKLDNVLVAPHMGGLDVESELAMSNLAAQCLADLFQGRWPEGCVVNAEIRPNWKW